MGPYNYNGHDPKLQFRVHSPTSFGGHVTLHFFPPLYYYLEGSFVVRSEATCSRTERMSNDSLEGILSRYGLQTKDLEKNFSRKVIVRLATEAPVDCKTLGQYLNFSEEKLAEIEVRSEDEDQRKVMLFQAWSESKELNLSILVLADTLYHKQRPDLVELLCDIVISTSKSDMGGYLCDSEVNQLCVQGEISVANDVSCM